MHSFLNHHVGIPFISFQDAAISFDRYQRLNLLETKYGMLQNILQFYKETFTNQAASLLGSLDILGNPVGFIQDLSSGVEGLLKKGNIGGLFFNVAHGFSDSAAKVFEFFLCPVGFYLLKVNNGKTRTICEICSIKSRERRQ